MEDVTSRDFSIPWRASSRDTGIKKRDFKPRHAAAAWERLHALVPCGVRLLTLTRNGKFPCSRPPPGCFLGRHPELTVQQSEWANHAAMGRRSARKGSCKPRSRSKALPQWRSIVVFFSPACGREGRTSQRCKQDMHWESTSKTKIFHLKPLGDAPPAGIIPCLRLL
jgi:hypothetical protein